MDKISREVAEAEVKKWLDKKKVFESTRELRKDNIDVLVDAICEGVLVLNETDNSFTHELLFPFTGEKPLSKLTYKGRLNDNILRPYLKGVPADDGDMRLNAIIAALTDSAKGIVSGLDSLDKKIASSIAIFFL